jgi:NADH-quinone oxidoreductase subunit J
MSLALILFFVFGTIAVVGAILMIFVRQPIHSALALVLVMVSLAALYLLQGAEFIATVQVIVYAGAIMVLFVFVIMLLNAGNEERTNVSKLAKFAGLPLAVLMTIGLAVWIARASAVMASPSNTGVHGAVDPTRELSTLLFHDYLFPFEATSILVLIAIIGALVLAKRDS